MTVYSLGWRLRRLRLWPCRYFFVHWKIMWNLWEWDGTNEKPLWGQGWPRNTDVLHQWPSFDSHFCIWCGAQLCWILRRCYCKTSALTTVKKVDSSLNVMRYTFLFQEEIIILHSYFLSMLIDFIHQDILQIISGKIRSYQFKNAFCN